MASAFFFGIPKSIDGQHPRGSADTLKVMRMAIDDLGNRYERIQVPAVPSSDFVVGRRNGR